MIQILAKSDELGQTPNIAKYEVFTDEKHENITSDNLVGNIYERSSLAPSREQVLNINYFFLLYFLM